MKPKRLLALLVFAAAAFGSGGASAASITYDVRNVTNLDLLPNYVSAWNAQGTPITSASLSDFNGAAGIYPGGFSHLTVDFSVGTNLSSVRFQLAPDGGLGGQLLLDGVALDTNDSDLWWGGDWNASSELLSGIAPLLAGRHVLEAYWVEACCSGAQGGRFSLNGRNWQGLSVANLDALAVPEPGTLALLGLGFAGLSLSRPRKSA